MYHVIVRNVFPLTLLFTPVIPAIDFARQWPLAAIDNMRSPRTNCFFGALERREALAVTMLQDLDDKLD